MKVLYVCHGHPALAKGGGELAAWRLFEFFSERYGAQTCGFLAAASSAAQLPPGCEVMSMGPQQWLIKPSSNSLIHDTAVSLRGNGQLHQALANFQPDLIHLHHYLHVGIDLVHALRSWFPAAKVLLTLHEYWGPCALEGRLLRSSGELCNGPDPEACNQCLGGQSRDGLAIRALRVQRLFGVIDHLIAPSFFLKQRYLHWGVPANRISVMENLPAVHSGDERPSRVWDGVLRLGYCGQVNPWKGLDLILEAVALAHAKGVAVRLEVHGLSSAALEDGAKSGIAFLRICADWVNKLGPEVVDLMGPYASEDLQQRLSGLDALVMGSSWYENAPMVIQEAFQYGLPVLAPRLGGMAEKVRHGITGLLFEPASPPSLAMAIEELAANEGMRLQMKRKASIAALRLLRTPLQHQKLYLCLLKKDCTHQDLPSGAVSSSFLGSLEPVDDSGLLPVGNSLFKVNNRQSSILFSPLPLGTGKFSIAYETIQFLCQPGLGQLNELLLVLMAFTLSHSCFNSLRLRIFGSLVHDLLASESSDQRLKDCREIINRLSGYLEVSESFPARSESFGSSCRLDVLILAGPSFGMSSICESGHQWPRLTICPSRLKKGFSLSHLDEDYIYKDGDHLSLAACMIRVATRFSSDLGI
jgi:glycosyltransferase involved in cell wall biosynthesis